MKINILAKNLKLTQAIKVFIEEKITPLEKFVRLLYNENTFASPSGKVKSAVEAWVEIGKETLHHRKGPFFRAEVQIRFSEAGRSIRAEAFSKDLRMAIVEAKDELQRKLKKEKGKIIASKRRKSRTIK